MEKVLKILSVSLENFGSYEKLYFDFQNQGLTLIQGPTGSGKSTLCDAVPWCIFGRTAKGGLADEVLQWPGDKITKGVIRLEGLTITRIRGKGKNDFYISRELNGLNILDLEQKSYMNFRGKDLLDTQRILNQTLRLDADLYLSGAYFHEFSQTAQFFTTTAKNRRAICEQLADLSLPAKLQEDIATCYKNTKNTLQDTENRIRSIQAATNTLIGMQKLENTRFADWESNNQRTISQLESALLQFESDKSKMPDIIDTCPTCGATDYGTHSHKNTEQVNPYAERLERALLVLNPHTGAKKDYSEQIDAHKKILERLEENILKTKTEASDLELLSDIVTEFRSVIVKNVILRTEEETNRLLTEYFDSEIKITLDVSKADKLEVEITKDSNMCAYSQLSKGQRQILKLAFGVAVMKEVSNYNGVNFDCLFFDEATDGMDDSFKMKSVRLLESLALDGKNVFLVEHSEQIKAMIANKYSVALVNGKSQIEKD